MHRYFYRAAIRGQIIILNFHILFIWVFFTQIVYLKKIEMLLFWSSEGESIKRLLFKEF